MVKVAVEQFFDGSIPVTDISSYDATKVNLGTLMGSFNLGSNYEDKFVGPLYTQVMRPTDQTTAFAAQAVSVVKWSPTKWWVFYSDNTAAAATRRIGLFSYNPITHLHVWQGFITLTYPVATTHTIRGFNVSYELYTTGTVTVSGTSVTGTGTTWLTDRIPVGCRIGFGSTDPTQILTWHQISAVSSDTSITLQASATSETDVPYVIEDLRIITVNTNATATNGGLFITKGLRYELFSTIGSSVPAATTIDNIRAVYWLKDAGTVTNTVAGGGGLEAKTSWTSQFIYCVDGAATSLKIYKYNTRAALTLTAGAATLSGSDIVATGSVTVSGNISQNDNGLIASLNHGPGQGVSSLYFATTTRYYRVPLSAITAASTTYLTSGDFMAEIPPGGTSTHTASNSMGNSYYDESIDRLLICAASRLYITRYKTDASPMDAGLGITGYQMDGAASSGQPFPHSLNNGAMVVASVDGRIFLAQSVASTTGGAIYIHPVAADWSFASTNNARIIFPKITLPSTSKLYRVRIGNVSLLGSSNFGKTLEPVRLLYRTSGIDDNSGSFNSIPLSGDLTGITTTGAIQFACECRTIGDICIPSRITDLCLTYEDQDDIPSQYAWSMSDTDLLNRRFGFVQISQFGGSLGTHTINIYRVDTGALVLTQASTGTSNGTFEYYNGSVWVAGLGSDTIGTRRRFSATGSIPDGVSVYAVLTVE